MWLARRIYEQFVEDRGRREELTRRVDAQQATITFLTTRINQLETERTLLLRHITGVEFPMPRLTVTSRAQPPDVDDPRATLDALSQSGIFDDDPRHAAGWNADGSVHYGRRPPIDDRERAAAEFATQGTSA